MARSKTPSFVTELPLKVSSKQEKELLSRLQAARQLYNCCLGEALIRLRQVRNSEPCKQARNTKDKEQRIKLYQQADKENRFTDYDMKTFATLTANRSKWMSDKLGAHEKQTIGTRAFKAVKKLQLGQTKKVRYKVPSRYRSVEGQSNATGIKWRVIEQKRPKIIGKAKDVRNKIKCAKYALVWNGLELKPIIDLFNSVIAHGLNFPVKYCRILWRNLNGKRRWYVQLINEGLPYQKESNYIGEGIVGLDLNISNVAKMHRDLFTAFLARHVNDDSLSLLDAQYEYSGSEPILVDAWKLYQQTR
ncbi:MAG: hypothetical protein AAFV71_24600, partial [Cyanobacteria bacterium J06633_8]